MMLPLPTSVMCVVEVPSGEALKLFGFIPGRYRCFAPAMRMPPALPLHKISGRSQYLMWARSLRAHSSLSRQHCIVLVSSPRHDLSSLDIENVARPDRNTAPGHTITSRLRFRPDSRPAIESGGGGSQTSKRCEVEPTPDRQRCPIRVRPPQHRRIRRPRERTRARSFIIQNILYRRGKRVRDQ